jgi:hypothetical protein
MVIYTEVDSNPSNQLSDLSASVVISINTAFFSLDEIPSNSDSVI